MDNRKNVLKAIHYEKPDYIPMQFVINPSCWKAYPQNELFDLMKSHPFLFPDFHRPEGIYVPDYPNVAQKDHPYRDDWGCLWETTEDGITGTVVAHPLEEWEQFGTYSMLDPSTCMGIGKIDWESERKRIAKKKSEGKLTMEGLRHGHTFLQMAKGILENLI